MGGAHSSGIQVVEHADGRAVERAAERGLVSRRTLLRAGATGTAFAGFYAARSLLAPSLEPQGLWTPDGIFGAASMALADSLYREEFPVSPLILEPFEDELPVPRPLAPSDPRSLSPPPGPGPGQQNSFGNETHQLWTSDIGFPEPIVYEIDVRVAEHAFTTSKVLPIDDNGRPTESFDEDGKRYRAGTERNLPDSTIYGFNGTFPGPLINAEYGRPVLVRFTNRLDENPRGLDRQDFGSPDLYSLTHLHNGHTAPESDGNPHYAMRFGPGLEGYPPGSFVDNLYLNWPAGGDDREKQSFFWFHDHVMDHTGDDVYKGLLGLYKIYDPKDGFDDGDERTGLRLPGVRDDRSDGTFDVEYDIPLAFFDCCLDDGVARHQDAHDARGAYPAAGNPRAHPEWWGKTFYRHFPNHGFVGDLFTVNGVAYPVLEVKRRKYRFRFLDASIARIYEFALMSSTKGPKSAASLGYGGDELQGQYRIPDGQQSMQFTQIATDGGLLPFPVVRDTFELWPAKRKEVIIDFTRYLDGTPTTKGDEVYLTNIMKMGDGRMWDKSTRSGLDPDYKIPLLKFVIGDTAEDDSVVPDRLRDLPPLPGDWRTLLKDRLIFEVHRGSAGGELEWLINGEPFDPNQVARSKKNPRGKRPLAQPKRDSAALWEFRNGGGGWVHPVHLHMEEHQTVMRNGRDVIKRPTRPDEAAREDTATLDPKESVILFRRFRGFTGPYVAHCHNLAHEDHAMMFAWEIVP